MIALRVLNHNYTYEINDILKMFFGKEDIRITYNEALEECQSFLLVSALLSENGKHCFTAEITGRDGIHDSFVLREEGENWDSEKLLKRAAKISVYKLLSKVFGKEFPWGILSGIRPVKLIHELMNKKLDASGIIAAMNENYLVSEDRAKLALDIAEADREYIYPADDRKVSVYVGIPFCPSRCHYCSFTSNSIKACGGYVQGYLDCLHKEMVETGTFLKTNGISVQSVYLGGGTPTSINEAQLAELIDGINDIFGDNLEEFTCEAGRPDTITREKLGILKEGKVTRLSINPQTMNDETLKRIGRAHDSAAVIESFWLAREMGFDNINMDIILGLPGETTADLKITLEELKKLQPDSVTVHTMAIKRASIYNELPDSFRLADDDEITGMMELAKLYMQQMGLKPYYLYRQKHMLQNMENIGFSKMGKECIYNMQIIEEKQTNAAFGADAVTKAVFNMESRIERQHNIKDLRLYIENIDKMIENKIALLKETIKKC